MRFLAVLVLLLVGNSVMGQTQTAVVADVQGSVAGGWPSALSGQSFSSSVLVANATDYQYYTAPVSFGPDSWPTPNEFGAWFDVANGDRVEAVHDVYGNDKQLLIGSDGRKYAAWISGPVENAYYAVPADLGNKISIPLTVSIAVEQEEIGQTDPTPQDGDTNKDGDVDWFDFQVVQSNYGMLSGATWGHGDFDGDGDVDFDDYLATSANYEAW